MTPTQDTVTTDGPSDAQMIEHLDEQVRDLLAEIARLRAELETARAKMQKKRAQLVEYRDNDCVGDDTLKRHAHAIAEARIAQIDLDLSILAYAEKAGAGKEQG